MISEIVERRLIADLRKEASQLKECFTRFMFQAGALSAAWLAIVVAAVGDLPYAALGGLPIVCLLMLVCRIGIHKFSTANRNYGYELHLARTAHGDYGRSRRPGAWSPAMRRIRWEEALRGWRIVQATVFNALYTTPANSVLPVWRWPAVQDVVTFLRWDLYRYTAATKSLIDAYRVARTGTACMIADGYPWFTVNELTAVPEDVVYHAGSYLRTTCRVLVILQYLHVLPLAIVAGTEWGNGLGVSCAVLCGVASAVIHLRSKRIRRRREILESELLSIHSCAIIWQAVVLAHYRALRGNGRNGYSARHYTERLVTEASDLCKHIHDIHGWVEGRYMATDIAAPAPKKPAVRRGRRRKRK